MSRLIDADKLIEDIEKLNLELFEEFKCADSGVMKITSNAQMYIICESVLPRIKEQPTAFDVDKVVEQLKEQAELKLQEGLKEIIPVKARPYLEAHNSYYEAIEIVKRGGIDE